MSYSISPQENLAHGIVRILQQLVSTIYTELQDDSIILDERIHDARTGFKQCRAMLRFIRYQLPPEEYEIENLHFRDLGRLLALSRDSYILVSSIDYLVEHNPDSVKADDFSTIRDRLERDYRQQIDRFRERNYQEEIVAHLRALHERISRWTVAGLDRDILYGIHKVYKSAQQHMEHAFAQHDNYLMHEWRKDIKYLWYQVNILLPEDPEHPESLAGRLHELSGYLGVDHDLLELELALGRMKSSEIQSEKEMLQKLIASEKKRLQALALITGKQLLNRDSDSFIENLYLKWMSSK